MVLGTMVCPAFISWMALLIAVGPLRALTVSESVITTFISNEKLVCECGNSIQDETIDYSVDVGLSVLAVRWFAACSPFVLALSAAFCPCGSIHSFELRSFPGFGFQQCIFDGLCALGGLPACLVSVLVVKLTRIQLQVLVLLACACGSLCILASDGVMCLYGASLMALDCACCFMAATKRASAALCSHFEGLMSGAIAAATALLHFFGQVIVHAAAAFEAAFVFASFRSLLTEPAASAQTYFATVRIWHAAAAPAAAVKGFFHYDLLAEPAVASEYEVVNLIQPTVAATRKTMTVVCLILQNTCSSWFLVCASGLCTIFSSGFGVFFMMFLQKICRCLMVRGRIKVSKRRFLKGFKNG